MKQLSDFVKAAEKARQQAAQARASVKPLYEQANDAWGELEGLRADYAHARETIEAYQDALPGVSDSDYLAASEQARLLPEKIKRAQSIFENHKALADGAGLKATYDAQGATNKLLGEFDAWQREQRAAFLDAVKGL